MPGFNESFFASKTFTIAAAAIAFLAAAILFSAIFRITFGRRLRLPRNGRARQPRLGIVDAFDLDRQRQLVIVRRDNVEHLLMIGGPNDLVIEPEIIRAESRDPRDLREARIRDRELREKEPRDSPPVPAGISWPFPAEASPPDHSRRKMPFPATADLDRETGLTAAVPIEEIMRDTTPTIVSPTPRPPVFPLPPRRVPPPLAPLGQRPPDQHEPLQGRAGLPEKPEPGSSPAKGFPRAPLATPFLRPSPLRQVQGIAAEPVPSSPPGTVSVGAPAAGSHPGFEEVPTSPEVHPASRTELSTATEPAPEAQTAGPAAPAAAAGGLILEVPAAAPEQDDSDTIEEEMARLLGRGPR